MRGISTGTRLLTGLILVISLLGASTFSVFAQEDDPSPPPVVEKSDEATPEASEETDVSEEGDTESDEATESDSATEDDVAPDATPESETDEVEDGEASETEEDAEDDFGAAVVASPDNYYVAVGCTYDSGLDESVCTFTASVANDDAAITAFTVLFESLCSEPVDVGLGVETETGYSFESTEGTIVLAGEVIPLDAATYSVEADGSAFDASGDALTCVQTVDIVAVGVYKYNCPADPGAVTPGVLPVDCEVGVGVSFDVTDDGGDAIATITTDDSGLAVIEVPAGTSLTVTELVPPGWEPVGSGSSSVVAEEGAALAFVNVPGATLQIAHGSCPTAGESWTEFVVIGPHTLAARAAETGCEAVPGGTFQVAGPESLSVTTDENGDWMGPLTPGSYTLTGGVVGATSDPFDVELTGITVIIVIDHVEYVGGAVGIERVHCIGEPAGTTTIAVGTPPGNGGTCGPTDGQFQLNDGQPFWIGTDGERVMPNVPVGDYRLTDLTSGEFVDIAVTEGGQVDVGVTQLELGGAVNLQFLSCSTPVTTAPNPAVPAYWDASCVAANAGAAVKLLDGSGNEVGSGSTDGGGAAGWANLLSGNYAVQATTACAAFVGSSSATGGFAVAAGGTTTVRLFTCPSVVVPPPDDGTSGVGEDPPGDGENDGNNTTNPNTTAVTTLPQTGAGIGNGLDARGGSSSMLVVLGLVSLGGLAWVSRRRRRIA